MFPLSYYTQRRAPRYARRNDWGALLSRAQAMASFNNSVGERADELGADIHQFNIDTRARMEALRARITEMRPAAEQADAEFAEIEDAVMYDDGAPPELIEIVNNTTTQLSEFLDEVESQLDELF